MSLALTLKLKYDLRRLIAADLSWTNPINDEQRHIWVKNFQTIEEVRDFLYIRCTIPSDAISNKARILLFSDAADIGIIIAAYACYERPGNVWSCDLLFAKGLLGDENWTIPLKELHGLSILSNVKVICENSLQSWTDSFYAFNDSEISLFFIANSIYIIQQVDKCARKRSNETCLSYFRCDSTSSYSSVLLFK